MRLDTDDAREALAEAWERWVRRCAELTPEQWAIPKRCRPWDVRALVAHLCPQPAMFDVRGRHGEALTPDAAVNRFTERARILRATTISSDDVIKYPAIGSTTLAVVAR